MDHHDPRSIHDLEAGDHLLAPYQSWEELRDGMIQTVLAASDRGHRCLLCLGEETWQAVRTRLEKRHPALRGMLDSGELTVVTRRDRFLSDDAFDAGRMTAMLDEEVARTRKDGFETLWLADDVEWTVGEADPETASRGVEVGATDHVSSDDLVAVCFYRRSAFPDAVLERAIHAHPLVLLKGGVLPSPFFADEEGESSRVDRMMQALERAGTEARLLRDKLGELQEAHERLRLSRRLEAVGRLAGGIAHDFNNLLTVIRAQAELLRLESELSDAAAAELEMIQGAADRAATLTSQLLSFSRGQLLRPRTVDLSEVVGEMAHLVDRVIGAEAEVVLELADELPAIEVDPDQLEQVVLNLAVNAREAMSRGGTLTLTTARTVLSGEEDLPAPVRPGAYTLLRVSDTGRGIEEEVQVRVFDPFFTTRSESGGTGLGLSMAYGFVKQSDGYIFVDSTVGEGTTFTLYFPVADRPPEKAGRPSPDVQQEALSGTVLLVEDDPAVRRVACKILRRAGLEVVPAEDAEAGLEALAGDRSLHAVLTDLGLPGMSGQALAEHVRARHPHLPVIVMSGYAVGSAEGPDELPPEVPFVQKPFTRLTLMAAVGAVLRR